MMNNYIAARHTGIALLLGALSLVSALLSGCSSDSETPCGGVVRDGQCFKKCDDTKCSEGNKCVITDKRPEGFCSIECQDVNSCPIGYECKPDVKLMSEDTTGNFCASLGLPSEGKPGATCKDSTQCDTGHKIACYQGSCAQGCSSVTSGCAEGLACTAVAGEATGVCTASVAKPGQYGTDCPTGEESCDTASGFGCFGPANTPDAICTKPDGCSADADCPTGFWCGAVRQFQSDKKNVDFSKTPKACLRRTFCAPCETNLDCSHETNAVCVPDKNGEKFCSLPCDPATNSCIIGASCVEVSPGLNACRPDVGYCHSANATGCDPCRIDTDCGQDAICSRGKLGWKPSMNWCSPKCGANGECGTAPNGLEMVCLNENQYDLGGPFKAGDPDTPNYIYGHCYAPFTVDNSELFPKKDPPNGVCGNAKRDPGEECDDGNKTATDGCDNCMVTAKCTFKLDEPNKDGDPIISPAPEHIAVSGAEYEPAMPYVIAITKTRCATFKVEGAIETAGDIDNIALQLPADTYMWLETFTSSIGSCSADLRTEVRAWKDLEKIADPTLLDLSVPCEKLTTAIIDMENGKLCPGTPNHLACGSCAGPGYCGSCDEDNGIGQCNRMMLSTTASSLSTTSGEIPIYYEGRYKMMRIYARDPQATVANYIVIGSRFVAQANSGATTPPATSCY